MSDITDVVSGNVECNDYAWYNRPTKYFRWYKENNYLMSFNEDYIATTWDPNWQSPNENNSARTVACGNTPYKGPMSAKPNDGSTIQCRNDGEYYRYSESNNSIYKYDNHAIGNQYNVQPVIIQKDELDISKTMSIPFSTKPFSNIDYINKPVTYTFYLEVCIEKVSYGNWRNIMNHGIFDYPPGDDGRRPCIYIYGYNNKINNKTYTGRLNIFHSADHDNNNNMTTDFIAKDGEWFSIMITVNRNIMTVYINGLLQSNVLKHWSGPDGPDKFNWTYPNKITTKTINNDSWVWNAFGTNGAPNTINSNGYIKVRNAMFWPISMAIDIPKMFYPFKNALKCPVDYYQFSGPGLDCNQFTSPGENIIKYDKPIPNDIKDGQAIQCVPGGPIYKYNKGTLLQYLDNNIAKECDPNWNSYLGYDCNNVTISGVLADCNSNTVATLGNVPDETSVKCNEYPGKVFRLINNNLMQYEDNIKANTWDINWSKANTYDCKKNYAGVITMKPSDGSPINCNGKYYRYNSDGTISKYETTAIAKQYSNFQSIQENEIDISTRQNFANFPTFTWNKPVAYTFSFDCCIEKKSNNTRNIMNNTYNDLSCPQINILNDNTIEINHSNTKINVPKYRTKFKASDNTWFTCTFIVNVSTIVIYINGKLDVKTTDGSTFRWNNRNICIWNYINTNKGFVKVRNVRFWPFAMALDIPDNFNPVESKQILKNGSIITQGSFYVDTIYTTKLPESTNCFYKIGNDFVPNMPLTFNNVIDGDTLKCKGYNDKYRYILNTNKLYKYPTNEIAKSWDSNEWDPNYANYENYKAYDCGNYLTGSGIMPLKPAHKSLVRCNNDYNMYVDITNTIYKYQNNNIVRQYNENYTGNEIKIDCDVFYKGGNFFPTQNLSPDAPLLNDGDTVTCDNNDTKYYYNKNYDVLMKYNNSDIASSWNSSYDNYKSYKCSTRYTDECRSEQDRNTCKGVMDIKPKKNDIIQCSNLNNGFYYSYNDDNSLKPWPNIDSVREEFPDWKGNIYNNDCRQYTVKEPRFYDQISGKGNVVKVTPADYNGCNSLPFVPTEISTRSMNRDGENIVLYTDPNCLNQYTYVDYDKNLNVNIEYTNIKANGSISDQTNPTHYKIVPNNEYIPIKLI